MVSCRYHLLLNVTSDGRMYSQAEFDESDPASISDAIRSLDETCALDVAERGEHTLEEVGELVGLGRPDVFRIVDQAQGKVAVLVADQHPDDPYFRLMAEQELKKR